LRPRDPRGGRHGCSARGEVQEFAARKFHGVPSEFGNACNGHSEGRQESHGM